MSVFVYVGVCERTGEPYPAVRAALLRTRFIGLRVDAAPTEIKEKNDCVLLAKCTSVECCFALCWGCFWVSVRMHHGKSVWGMRCSCFSKDNFIYVTSDSTTYSWSLPAGLPVRTEILSQTPKIWIGKAPRVSFHDYFCFSFLLKWNWDLFNISLEKKTHTQIGL